MIMAIALYFTLFWGYEALRVLTSPTYGLEDVWRSQYVFGLGSYFKLQPMGLMKLAAFFGALKLAVALTCAIHIVDRLRHVAGGKANTDVLEAGLIMVVAISVAAAGPAAWTQNSDLLREQVLHLLLAAVAVALCLVERNYSRRAVSPVLASTLPRAEVLSPLR
ncbi:hypothetical protein DXH78_12265 [Undibacter mobilis]|uniref:Uncharacterized protein n=2 Tax=Undibacter mobilis TaxID=2292256 RepID=A0A371BCN8_9BRAD|nr:hypothetical protein DXH78_12265 [Undibacter mobilis]